MDDSEKERQDLLVGLMQKKSNDTLTIRTVTSADTIPLGTDLDPMNGYCNKWAAEQVCDPQGKCMAQFNLGCRVVDFWVAPLNILF